jgi:hypothetical protein
MHTRKTSTRGGISHVLERTLNQIWLQAPTSYDRNCDTNVSIGSPTAYTCTYAHIKLRLLPQQPTYLISCAGDVNVVVEQEHAPIVEKIVDGRIAGAEVLSRVEAEPVKELVHHYGDLCACERDGTRERERA